MEYIFNFDSVKKRNEFIKYINDLEKINNINIYKRLNNLKVHVIITDNNILDLINNKYNELI